MAKLIGLDKVQKLWQIISQNGGIRASLYKLYRMDDVKDGRLVGTDKYGNKYYENPRYFYGRNRWVEYAEYYGLNYDGSQIPAEWYGWMHYKTDLPPTQDPDKVNYKWIADHTEVTSGSSEQFTPYTTTPPKIFAWDPKQAKTHK